MQSYSTFIVYFMLFLSYLINLATADLPSLKQNTEDVFRFIIISMPEMHFRLNAVLQRINMLGLYCVVDVIVPKTRYEILHMENVKRYTRWAVTPAEVFTSLNGDQRAYQQTSSYWTRDITIGEVSLTLAHVDAAIESLNSNATTIILEDDAVFSDDFVREFGKITRTAPSDFDYIFLGDAAIGERGRQQVSSQLCVRGYAYQAHGYIISRKGAERIKYLKEKIFSNVIAFDELTSALTGMHPRQDLNTLFVDGEEDGFKMYSVMRNVVYQDPNDHFHDTEY